MDFLPNPGDRVYYEGLVGLEAEVVSVEEVEQTREQARRMWGSFVASRRRIPPHEKVNWRSYASSIGVTRARTTQELGLAEVVRSTEQMTPPERGQKVTLRVLERDSAGLYEPGAEIICTRPSPSADRTQETTYTNLWQVYLLERA